MKAQLVTELPFGYDEQTNMMLVGNNIVIAHPVMPPMIYDTSVMRWVEIATEITGVMREDKGYRVMANGTFAYADTFEEALSKVTNA